MGSLTIAKHQITEIDGVRCTLVESGISAERLKFLSELLTQNGLEVKTREDAAGGENAAVTYTLGVTDIIFNPIYAVYERTLFRVDGKVVSPAYWRQQGGDTTGDYWEFGKTTEADPYE